MPVNIEWVAHACFRVWRDGGPVVVMDPYTRSELEKHGLPRATPSLEGDTVICSSLTDLAHGNPKLVKGSPRVIDALDIVEKGVKAEIDGSSVVAVGAAEHPEHTEHDPMDNALYSIKFDELWVMHIGDLGYGLTADELAPFVGHCDVLLAITGDHNTIPLLDLDFMIEHLEPRWIIPMHYFLEPFGEAMAPVGKFLDRRRSDPVLYPKSTTIRLPTEIPGSNGRPAIIVLEPAAYEVAAVPVRCNC